MPPGIYASGERRIALNVLREGDRLAPFAALPEGVRVETLERAEEIRLGPWLIGLALALLALDVLATLLVSGRLGGRVRGAARPPLPPPLVAGLALVGGPAEAQDTGPTPRRSTPRTRRCSLT